MVKKNLRTLQSVSNKASRHNGKLRFLLLNTQSIRNKYDALSEYMRSEAIDITIATKTWLINSIRDMVWLESNELVKDGYQISVRNREGKRGEGLAIIYRDNIRVTEITQKKQRSFEVTHWKTTVGNSPLNILGIYHPPYSVGQNTTNMVLLDKLTELLIVWMTSYTNAIICGDFKLHINNSSYREVHCFIDTMGALGLKQHVSFQTHHTGNILDIIFTKTISHFNVRTFKGRFISDHRGIEAELNIKIQHDNGKIITFRNLKNINVEEFGSNLDLGHTENMRDLELINKTYEEELSGMLYQLAPGGTRHITRKEKRPWFNDDIASLRGVLRRSEKPWMRIRSENNWSIYKQIRKQYQDMLTVKKKGKISRKLEECGSDGKKLFQLVYHLTGCKPNFPLPTRKSDKELADEFANFFFSKIVKIREEPDHHPLYQPSKSDIPKFSNFRKLQEDQEKKLVRGTKSKSCELDPIPTTLLKKFYLTSYQH